MLLAQKNCGLKRGSNDEKRLLSIVLTLCLLLTLLPTAAMAVSTPNSFTVNADKVMTTVIKYSGRDWYVIGNNGTGVASGAGTLTLLSKDSDGTYYYDAVLWAVDKDITSGTGAAAFCPLADCSRAQIVTFLYRYFNK